MDALTHVSWRAWLIGTALVLASASAAAESLPETFKRVRGSVVVVETTEKVIVSGRRGAQQVDSPGLGSGVLIDRDGRVITAAHVVHVADTVKVRFADGIAVPAKVVSSEPTADVALLKIDHVPATASTAVLGDSDAAEVGDQVFIVGAPYGLTHTLTVGYISARHQPDTISGDFTIGEFLQTDAAINRGNSGGPMFNLKGEVIGIASFILTQSGGFEGLGFAVSANTARRLLLEEPAFWGGVQSLLLRGELAAFFNLPQPAGLLVQRVAANSPAAKLGLRPGRAIATIAGQEILLGGDVILAVDNITITDEPDTFQALRKRLREQKKDQTIKLKVLRGGKIRELP